MRILRSVLKIGSIVILIIVITEIALRLTVAYKLQRWSECQYQAVPVLGYMYKPNSAGVIRDAAYSRPYKINSQGFAGEEFTTKKAKGIYRIAVLGASEETGLYTNGPLNFVKIAEDLFKKQGYKVEIINLAIDGHGRSMRNIAFAETACAEYEPDLILYKDLEFPLQDFMQYRTTYKDVLIKYTDSSQSNLAAAKAYIDNEIAHKDFRLYLYDYSYIYRYLVKYYLEQYQKSEFWQSFGKPFFGSGNKMECYARHLIFWPGYQYKPTNYSEEESMQIFKDLHEMLLKRNIRLIVFNTYAMDDPTYYKQLFAKNQLDYLPLQVIQKDEYSFGKEDGHSSQEGHKAIGYALFNALKDSIPPIR